MMLTEETPPPQPKPARPAPKAARPAPPTPTKSMHPKTRAANTFPAAPEQVEASPAGKPTTETKKVREVNGAHREAEREAIDAAKQAKKEVRESKKEAKEPKATPSENAGHLNTLLSNKRDAFNMSELADTISQATKVIETNGKGTDMYYSSHLDVMRVLVDVLFGDATGFEGMSHERVMNVQRRALQSHSVADLLFSVVNLKSAVDSHLGSGSTSTGTQKAAGLSPPMDHSNPELSESMLGSGEEPVAPIMITQQSDIVVPMHPANKRSRTTYDSQQSSIDDSEDGPTPPTSNKKR
jgi:hypothetical protein